MTPDTLYLFISVLVAAGTWFLRYKFGGGSSPASPTPGPANPSDPSNPAPVLPVPLPPLTPGAHPIMDAILALFQALNAGKAVTAVHVQVLHPDQQPTHIMTGPGLPPGPLPATS